MEFPYLCNVKVHRLVCLELIKFIDRIINVLSAIESARPRCMSGLQALCSLHGSIDKANLLLRHCSECSKLYLAMTADDILLRCEKIRNSLHLSLSEIQSAVPLSLAGEISKIIDDLKAAKFILEPSEHEAGRVVLALLQQDISRSPSVSKSEIEALQLAALRLDISSPLAFMIEKQSIKTLLNKVHDKVHEKEIWRKKILKHLLYLLRKYRQLIWQLKPERILTQQDDSHSESLELQVHAKNEGDDIQTDEFGIPAPPEHFKCPISMRLLYDPVVIASGKTFERVWIEKWFSEGHQTCPLTHMKLEDFSLTKNSELKGLISKNFRHGITIHETYAQRISSLLGSSKTSSGSVASFQSSMDDLCLQVSEVSLQSSNTSGKLDSLHGKDNDGFDKGLHQMNRDSNGYRTSKSGTGFILDSLNVLHSLSWGSQRKAVENVKKQLEDSDVASHLVLSNDCIEGLLKYLNDGHDLHDVKAQKDGAEVLLSILSYSRIETPIFKGDDIFVLVSLLDSQLTGAALTIIEILSRQQHYKSGLVASGMLPFILKVLDTGIREFEKLAIDILCNLCSEVDTSYHFVYLDCIPKLASYLSDPNLAGCCLDIFKNLCNIAEGRAAVAESNMSTTFIAKLLKPGSEELQEGDSPHS